MAGGANYVLDKGYKCGGAVGQFRLVKFGSADDTVVVSAAATDTCIGVCQETISSTDATNGRVADIRILGISRVVVGSGGVTRGQFLTSDASGGVIAASAAVGNQRLVGMALETLNAGDIGDALLLIGGQLNTAVS